MIVLRHKQTDKEWTYSATVWFKKNYDLEDYTILEWYDVVELINKEDGQSLGKMEKRDAIKYIDLHPYLKLKFKEITPNQDIEHLKISILEKLYEKVGVNPNEISINGITNNDVWDLLIALQKDELVTLTKSLVTINSNGRIFIKKLNEMKTPVSLKSDKNEVISEILYQLRKDEILPAIEDETMERESAIKELNRKGLIEKINNIYRLTDLGFEATDSNLPYPDCLPKRPSISQIHIGHNITGNIHNSTLNQDIGNTASPSKSKTHPMQWVAWIGGLIGVAIAIYKLFLAK